MDCVELSRRLAKHVGDPLFVIDARRRIVIASPPLCKRLGTSKEALIGRLLCEFLASDDRAFDAFLRGESASLDSGLSLGTLRDGLGRLQPVSTETERLPGDTERYLCRVVFKVAPRTFVGHDVDYEIEMRAGHLGILRRVAFMGGALTDAELGRPCFEVICGRQQSCLDCAAKGVSEQPVGSEQTVLRYLAGSYEIRTAVRVSRDLVRVALRHLPDHRLRDAQSARIEDIARRAGLSRREREVLSQVLHGAAIGDVAEALGITARTVKFHLANLLTKLGADSRADLLRVLT